MQTDYNKQAEDFLAKFGIKFRATLSDTKTPQWADGDKHGHHYRVTLSRSGANKHTGREWSKLPLEQRKKQFGRLTFDFWGSIADAEAGKTDVKPYDVLACISGDVHCPDTFKDFCAEFGYGEDSIKALQTFRRCSAFSKRLREFFTAEEITELSEIQ